MTESEKRAGREAQSEAMRLVGNQAQRVDPADLGITPENAQQELDESTARQSEIMARIPSAADNTRRAQEGG